MRIHRRIKPGTGLPPYINAQVEAARLFPRVKMRAYRVNSTVFGIAANTQPAAALFQCIVYIPAKPVDILEYVFSERSVIGGEIHYQQGFMISQKRNNRLEGGLVFL